MDFHEMFDIQGIKVHDCTPKLFWNYLSSTLTECIYIDLYWMYWRIILGCLYFAWVFPFSLILCIFCLHQWTKLCFRWHLSVSTSQVWMDFGEIFKILFLASSAAWKMHKTVVILVTMAISSATRWKMSFILTHLINGSTILVKHFFVPFSSSYVINVLFIWRCMNRKCHCYAII